MPNEPRPGVLSWASIVDDHTLDQAAMSAMLPFVRGPIALMPDAHFGIGATIGSVIPTQGAVIPAAVGVDIGCGMAALELPWTATGLPRSLSDVVTAWVKAIPAGVGKGHTAAKSLHIGEKWLAEHSLDAELSNAQVAKAGNQFGTLGSGNHFIELCLDENDRAWIILHSGSRGVGNQLAQRYMDIAKADMINRSIDLPDRNLAYLVEGTPEFDAYIAAVIWAQEYAAANRARMLELAYGEVRTLIGGDQPIGELRLVNCHHNYVVREQHRGETVWLTRKGAILASEGVLGLIPGSMGTASYIVRGLGNKAAYETAPHGAGRAMSRTAARKQFTAADLKESMIGKAWRADMAKELVDEIPRAYKDIDQVIADSADLVEVVHTLRQVANYKGT